MKKVTIVDYGLGNTMSVKRGLEHVGAEISLSSDPGELARADKLLLPGVGAFGNGIGRLRESGMEEALKEFVDTGKSLLGICLGMQMLMDFSEEYGEHRGLGFIPGVVMKIPQQESGKRVRNIPHIGWSALVKPPVCNGGSKSLLENMKEEQYYYFVHSYMVVPEDSAHLLAQCEYEGLKIAAAIKSENVTGLQFHPEKSGELGLDILRGFVSD
jgi:imidazole glycerol-phosphate synthase subunit HisH